jgi:hypothetical protein
LSIEDFFRNVAELAKVAPPRHVLPAPIAALLAKASMLINKFLPSQKHPILPDPVVFEMASKYWGLSSRYAQQDLAFQSRPPLETLKDTIEWLKNHRSPE